MSWKPTKENSQKGLVSLMVVAIIAILLTLITVGFTRVMNRELRQALDNDLSTQAYYAAESGLNDARALVAAIGANPGLANGIDPNTCINTTDPAYQDYLVNGGNISGDNIVKYTCILMDLNPYELDYDINAGSSSVFQVDNTGGQPPVRNLFLSWENKDTTNNTGLGNCANAKYSCNLPQENNYPAGAPGMLRVTVYPVWGNANHYSSGTDAVLANESRTYFLYPNTGNGGNSGAGTGDYGDNGTFIPGNCYDTHPAGMLPYGGGTIRYCNAEIQNLPPPGQMKYLYVHIEAIYKNTSVSIQGCDNSCNSPFEFSNVEAQVDVTGQGNDVLQRIRAWIPLNSTYSYPNKALQSMQTICKRFRVPQTGPNPGDRGAAFSDDPSAACNI